MKRHATALVLALTGLASWMAAAPPGPRAFTLEQVLAEPFPTDLTAAPNDGRVAWVANARGVRNIWLAEPPDHKGRAVTAYTEDDGQEIGDLEFTPDGKA